MCTGRRMRSYEAYLIDLEPTESVVWKKREQFAESSVRARAKRFIRGWGALGIGVVHPVGKGPVLRERDEKGRT